MQVHITDDALPAGALAAVCRDAHALADTDNFWVTKERILQGPKACSTAAELAVCLLYQHVAHLLPPEWQGAEYWVQVYKPGVGLGFHFDKDEHLLKATGQMQHPIWSSILYLTGSSSSSSNSSSSSGCAGSKAQQGCKQEEQQPLQQQQPEQQQRQDLATLNGWDGLRQAPTVILEQLYNQELGQPVPSAPSKSMLVWPLKGTYCLFDGRLGHGVLDSCSSSIRATLLVNWWTSCPQAVEQLQDSVIEQQQLTRLDSSTVQQMINSSSSSGAAAQADAGGCDGVAAQLAAVKLGGDSNSAAAEGAAQQQQQPQQQQQQQQQRKQQKKQVPCVRVTADAGAGDEDGGMYLVDDVLEAHGLTLVGPSAVSAVMFEHLGFVLCPVEDPSAGSNGDGSGSNGSFNGSNGDGSGSNGSNGKPQTLGAFVSAELMGDNSSSCSSEGSDGKEQKQ